MRSDRWARCEIEVLMRLEEVAIFEDYRITVQLRTSALLQTGFTHLYWLTTTTAFEGGTNRDLDGLLWRFSVHRSRHTLVPGLPFRLVGLR